jgi:uncharacterized protein (DUF2062 family)
VTALLPSSPPPVPTAAPLPRTFWQRRVLDPVLAQLTQGITPRKIALTFAIGGACALFPILGTTTALCIAAAILLKLNQPLIHLINQLLWPAHIPVMYACIRLGETLFGAPRISFDIVRMGELFWHHPGEFLHQFGATALHAVVAWCLLAPLFIGAVYLITLPPMRRFARAKPAPETPPSAEPTAPETPA